MRAGAVVRESTIVALGGGLGAVVAAMLLLSSVRPRFDLFVAVGIAAVGCWRLLRVVQPEPPPPASAAAEVPPEAQTMPDLLVLEQRLSWGSVDVDRFERRLRPVLVQIADERLRQRHGVDLRIDPDRSRRIVGEQLWMLMTGPPAGRPPNAAALERIVAAIEKI